METAAEWIRLEELKPWRDNPRRNDEAVAKVADSIKRFGFASPIIARREDMQIIAGHTRYRAAQSLDLALVPVRLMDLDPVDSRLLALADNRIGEIAEWDDNKLADILQELKDEGQDLGGLGWTDSELEDLIGDLVQDTEIADPRDLEEIDNRDYRPGREFKPGETADLGLGRIHCGDCLDVMRKIEENSIDAIVTDPPYQINFMAKEWDQEFDAAAWAAECYRILKPGGHVVAFAATRTIHRIMTALEAADFELRDLISWIYFSGFPKSLSISKQIGATPDAKKWDGWGTGLKPAQEPAVLARKPIDKGRTIAGNVLEWGTGAMNIDRSRFAYADPCWVGPNGEHGGYPKGAKGWRFKFDPTPNPEGDQPWSIPKEGRWPANIYHSSKPSRAERDRGLEEYEPVKGFDAVGRKEGSAGVDNPRAGAGRTALEVRNHHPTVKPLKLFDWLVGLVTPPDGVVLDTFAGSGTTGMAAQLAGYRWILIEREPDYCSIIHGRIQGAIDG